MLRGALGNHNRFGNGNPRVQVALVPVNQATRPVIAWLPCRLESAQELVVYSRRITVPGAGAKTAVGYGRFRWDETTSLELVNAEQQRQDQKQQAQREAERLASLSPLDRELAERAAAQPSTAPYRCWIKAVESGTWKDQPAVLRQVLQRIVSEMRESRHWKETPTKKKASKDNDYQDTLKVKQLLQAAGI